MSFNTDRSALPEWNAVLVKVALLFVEIGFQEQFRHAQQTVHGGANLMAHICEKLRFGLTCGSSLMGQPMRVFGGLLKLDCTLLHFLFKGLLILQDLPFQFGSNTQRKTID